LAAENFLGPGSVEYVVPSDVPVSLVFFVPITTGSTYNGTHKLVERDNSLPGALLAAFGHHVRGWQSVCAFGLTQAPVGGFANSPQGIPVGRAEPAPDSEVLGITDHGFGTQRPPLFEVLLDTGGFVITAQRRIDAFGARAKYAF
jgi:hypothetical protein